MAEEDDDFWNTSDVKAFNFDDEDHPSNTIHNQSEPPNSGVKTLGSILAARPQSNEPFLRPSVIKCSRNRIEDLIDYLDSKTYEPQTRSRQDPKTYIRDIVDKRVPIDFSPYRSKREKLLLLDSAICCSDGNAITAATIFISNTLKPSIFIEELKKRPIAVDHHVNYLEMTGRTRESFDLTKKIRRSTGDS